ncbi:cytochrome c biogenesis protein ResB [Geobacter grbiciae]|uniref:cytochrome c biogenesis protein ResB n=1 Tax=Geobacter grbiciae TaxID=155042 RepID=UPI001C023DB9|nr:cytochrome c biogenesis protein ResB [Geobacter grbiciae]MBT1073736.1 cytochrome c biogenesis protein ResB [Geobacter grbiciae]
MIKRIYEFLASLSLGLWLMGGVMALLAAGSFGGEDAASLNEMPLFAWLGTAPFSASWWLWGTLFLLVLMAVNTLLCSVEAIRKRYGKSGFVALLAPQLMHAGFLLIVLAHLLSAKGGEKQAMQLFEGSNLRFPGGSFVMVDAIEVETDPRGMPLDYRARMRVVEQGRSTPVTVRPNDPLFHDGVGIYLKQAAPFPYPTAYVEIHREPGAGWALAGALLFTAGNVMLLAVRRERRTA